MRNKAISVIGFIALIVLFIIGYSYYTKSRVTPDYKEVVEQNDSLNLIVDSLNLQVDTVFVKIVESKERIKVINQNYEKERTVIVIQSTDSDIVFFTEYLSKTFN